MSFASTSMPRHLLRGAIGFAALTVSLWTMNSSWWPSLIALPIALYALRGCPICWTIGLFETLAMRLHARFEREA